MFHCYISLLTLADVICLVTDMISAIESYLQGYRTDIIAKCIANFLVVGFYSLQQLESITLILIFICSILCNLHCGMLNRWTVRVADFVGPQMKVV